MEVINNNIIARKTIYFISLKIFNIWIIKNYFKAHLSRKIIKKYDPLTDPKF